jgi:hypothetical protein
LALLQLLFNDGKIIHRLLIKGDQLLVEVAKIVPLMRDCLSFVKGGFKLIYNLLGSLHSLG